MNFRWNIKFWRVFIADNGSKKNINFAQSFSFDDSTCCFADHAIFVIRCEHCLYNVIDFARNYFSSVKCSCVETDKEEVCKNCKQLAHSINFSVMKLCVHSRDVKKEFMEEKTLWKLTITLKKFWKEVQFSTFQKKKIGYWFPLTRLIGVIFL